MVQASLVNFDPATAANLQCTRASNCWGGSVNFLPAIAGGSVNFMPAVAGGSVNFVPAMAVPPITGAACQAS